MAKEVGVDKYLGIFLETLGLIMNGCEMEAKFDYSIDLDGELLYFEFFITRFVSNAKNYLVVSHFDVSERKRLEQRLKSTEELFNIISSNIIDVITLLDPSSGILYSTPSLRFQLGYSAEDLMDSLFLDLVAQEDRNIFLDMIKSVFSGDQNQISIIKLMAKNGAIYSFEFKGVSVYGIDGDLKQALFVARDVTERLKVEKEREEMEIHLRQSQKLEAIGQLAAGIAHEINTPTQYIGDNVAFVLESIKSLIDVFEEVRKNDYQKLSEKTAEKMNELDVDYLVSEMPLALNQSLEEVARVAKIVSAMKDFSHPGGAFKEKIDIKRAIESTITVSRNVWKYVAELNLDCDPDIPLVPCFPSDFNQVILNLIVNAAHAIEDKMKMDGGTKIGRIDIKVRKDGSFLEIRVRDAGTGIPKEYQSRLFEPFFTTKQVGRGTGQGLSISRSIIVDKHGGSISFETELGKGTVFIIKIPLGDE